MASTRSGKHIRAPPRLPASKFPLCCLWNSSNAGLLKDGPFSLSPGGFGKHTHKTHRQTEKADGQTNRRHQFHVAPAMSALQVRTPPRWMFKNALEKASHSYRITCERSESARDQRIALYKSDQQTNKQTNKSPIPMHGDAASDLSLKVAPSLLLLYLWEKGPKHSLFINAEWTNLSLQLKPYNLNYMKLIRI